MLNVRQLAAILAALLALSIFSAPVSARPLADDQVYRGYARRPAAVSVAPPACEDSAYKLLAGKWTTTYEWSFRASSTPSELNRADVKAVLRRAFSNVTGARNDCGLPDRVSATHRFLGTTSRAPSCMARDGRNVVGFGRMQFGVLAVTCFWTRNGRIVEADVKINSRESWALSASRCRHKPVLEATMTHEAGHVFGLDHIGERRHGRLTMSPYLDGPCNNQESSLGRGDVLGLEQLY